MLRFLLLALFVYFFLRMFARLIRGRRAPRNAPRSAPPPPRHGQAPTRVIDEMKPCPACGTFNPTRLAYEKKGLYFCNERCHEAHIRGESKS